jgi:uncharacterized membrane protein
MIVEAQVVIDGSKERIWSVIMDIENASEAITGIDCVEVLDRPESGLVGLKWRETRTLFGKTATEDMWITDSSENEFYKTRAESHGSIYISTRRLTDCQGGGTTLTMTHESKPQGLMAKLLSIPMGLVFSRMLKKCLMQDLSDIKEAVEKRKSPQ